MQWVMASCRWAKSLGEGDEPSEERRGMPGEDCFYESVGSHSGSRKAN